MAEMVVALRALLAALWGGAITLSADVVDSLRWSTAMQRQQAGETDGEFYFRGLRRLGWVVILTPIPLFALGMFARVPVLVAIVELFWGLFTALFAFAGAPFAAFVESLVETGKSGLVDAVSKGKVKISIEKYLSFVRTTLTVETILALILSVFPIKNNPGMFIVALVAALVLGLIGGSSKLGKKSISLLATIVIVAGFISFVFPKSYAMLEGWREKIDDSVAPAIDPENSLIPPGGTPETQADMDRYNRSITANTPSFFSSPEDTLSFNFNGERVLFSKGERRKDFNPTGGYSPIVVIPWGTRWHLETQDTTDVWFKDDGHLKIWPKMKPVDVGRRVAVFRFKSNYPVVVWLDRG